MKEPIYYGLFLDKPLTGTLKNQIPDQHITLAFRPPEEQQDIYNNLLGKSVTVKAIGFANDGKNEAIEVEIEGDIPNFNNEGPKHITVSIADGAKPFDSNKLEFTKLPEMFQKEFDCKLGAFMDKEKILFYDLEYYKDWERLYNEQGLELTLNDMCTVDKAAYYGDFILNTYLNEKDYEGNRPYGIKELAGMASSYRSENLLFDIRESLFYSRELKIDPLAHHDPTMGKIDFGLTYFHRYLKNHPEITGIDDRSLEKLIQDNKSHEDILKLIEYSNKIEGQFKDSNHIRFSDLVREAGRFEPEIGRIGQGNYGCCIRGYSITEWLKDLKEVIDKQNLLGETPNPYFGQLDIKKSLKYANNNLNAKIERRIKRYGEEWHKNMPVYEEVLRDR